MDLSLNKREAQVAQDLPQDLSVKKVRLSDQQLSSLSRQSSHAPSSHARDSSRVAPSRGDLGKAAPPMPPPPPAAAAGLVDPKFRLVNPLDSWADYSRMKEQFKTLAQLEAASLGSHSKKPAAAAVVDRGPAAIVVPKRERLVIPDPKSRTAASSEQRSRQQQQQQQQQHHSQGGLSQSPAPKQKTIPSNAAPAESAGAQVRKKTQNAHTITEQLLSNNMIPSPFPSPQMQAAISSLMSGQIGFNVPSYFTDYLNSYYLNPQLAQSSAPITLFPQKENKKDEKKEEKKEEEKEEAKEEKRDSQKRRRKQDCPRKRVKSDASLAEDRPAVREEDMEEEEDSESTSTAAAAAAEATPGAGRIFSITEEALEKVTDAAQNGELSKGLDEYFAQSSRQHNNSSRPTNGSSSSSSRPEKRERAEDDINNDNNDVDDADDNDGASLSPCSSGEGLSPFTLLPGSTTSSPSPSPHLKTSKVILGSGGGGGGGGSGSSKQPTSRVAVTLQNREERKALRMYGKQYTTPSGKTYPQRQVRDKDCSRCRYNCSSTISPEQRQAIFDHFWSLDSYVKRLYYYCQSIKEKPARSMKHTRECSREYTFLVGHERVRVCKGFYLATLDVSDKAVRIAMEKRKRGKGLGDKRGALPTPAPAGAGGGWGGGSGGGGGGSGGGGGGKSRCEDKDKDRVRGHIEHYLVQDIYKKTAEGSPEGCGIPGQDLDVAEMHQNYLQGCQEDGKEPMSEDVYRSTFNSEYDLSTVQV